MTSSFDQETNKVEDEYLGGDEDDLNDFIVDDDDDLDGFIVDDDDDPALKKLKQHQQQEEEEGGGEEEEEFEEAEEEEAPVGQQEVLSLREQLKADIRRKNAAMAAGGVGKAASSLPVRQPMLPFKDRFGTFFGPSRPALARRVIQEGCSSMMKELENTPYRKDAPMASKAQPAGASQSLQKPKFVSEEKRKAYTLRENRDYSSLFSDDAEAPPATMGQPGNGPTLVPKSDVHVRGPVNSAKNGRVPTGQPNSGHVSKGTAPSIQARVHSKAPPLGPGKQPLPDRKRVVSAGKNGSNLPAMRKTTGLQASSNGQKVQPSTQGKRPQGSLPGQRQQSSQGQRLQQASQSPGQQSNGRQLLQSRRPDSSVQGQRSGQNGSAEPHGRPKPVQKQLVTSSKLKASRPVEKRAVKRKSADGYSEISSMIWESLGYDPDKYVGRDDDDSDMEADYASIQKEERRSAILARKEDEEQLRLIEEEERRERAKKRKKPSSTKSE